MRADRSPRVEITREQDAVRARVLSMLAVVPEYWHGRVLRRFERSAGARGYADGFAGVARSHDAEGWVSRLAEGIRRGRLSPALSDGEIVAAADRVAADAMALAEWGPGQFYTVGQFRAVLGRFCDSLGVSAPGKKIEDGPAIARMTDAQWWRRALRVAQGRGAESVGIALGYVHRRAEIYATDATVERRQQQRRRNAAMLADTVAENLETGQEYTLAKLAELSTANPRIRRGELMVRIAGFEMVAKAAGHVAEFVTLTCPSRFHPMRKAGDKVIVNPKHDGSSPRDAQAYLVALWARIRAKLARMKLPVYGFRIAEPHHDATPHWHMLLFMPAELSAGRSWRGRFRAVFRRYALAADALEGGAKKHRCTFEAIDWSRGTAAGYVAKYVSKNIDGGGYQVQGDIEGDMQAVTPGHRVEAWASTWGIRQFQQIGGPPVGVWRELRRVEARPGLPVVVEAARAAADVGKNTEGQKGAAAVGWASFVGVMGGPVLARRDRPLRVAREAPDRLNRYGERAAPVPVGVEFTGWEMVTSGICTYPARVHGVVESRRYRWEIKRRAGVGFLGPKAPRTGVNNCTRVSRPFWADVARKTFVPSPETAAERETRESWEKFRGRNGEKRDS